MIALTKPFTFGSLFAGIGGLDLGLERAGMTCKWQVEIDKFATKILAKHWSDVPKYRDVRAVGKHNLSAVDLICGGFPCQDISISNKKNPQGIDGERSGLWKEFYRIICELRPKYALVENVSALLYRGIGRVLGDLAESGYDAQWQTLRASDFGAPHRRERVFIIAYSNQERCHSIPTDKLQFRVQGHLWGKPKGQSEVLGLPFAHLAQLEERLGEPSVFRSDDGLPYRMDRLGAIGNAVVPQVAEHIGRCILASVQWEVQS